jgi:hypothetical protein
MKTLRLAILAFLMATANFCIAQTGLFVNDSTVYFDTDTTSQNSTITIYVAVVNPPSSANFTGNITIDIYNDSSGTGGFGALIQVDSFYIQNATLTTADTVYTSDSLFINPDEFRSGINTVVIWPRTTTTSMFSTLDSARYSIFVINDLSSKEITKLEKLIVYPNPFSSKIWFTGLNQNGIEQVRVLDVLGKELLSIQVDGKTPLDLSNLSAGVYFIKMQSKDGKQIIIKTIKE